MKMKSKVSLVVAQKIPPCAQLKAQLQHFSAVCQIGCPKSIALLFFKRERERKPSSWFVQAHIRNDTSVVDALGSLRLGVGRGGLVVRLRSQRAPGSKFDSIEDPPCLWVRCT
ncbi:hypothetical protein AVEN_254632-1 [Araneus ventricosus]|uniref:Uncharacterized protein n=1 Tax=Araneus ventricosus TaxID=182803 RepID=A0A4Y2GET8_ARAVE|nr:hypothetical protein AVEN_254632-1 [Araneus ventricosus]